MLQRLRKIAGCGQRPKPNFWKEKAGKLKPAKLIPRKDSDDENEEALGGAAIH